MFSKQENYKVSNTSEYDSLNCGLGLFTGRKSSDNKISGGISPPNDANRFLTTPEFDCFHEVIKKLHQYFWVSSSCSRLELRDRGVELELTDISQLRIYCKKLVTNIDEAINDYNQPKSMSTPKEDKRRFLDKLIEIANKNHPDYETEYELIFLRLATLAQHVIDQSDRAPRNKSDLLAENKFKQSIYDIVFYERLICLYLSGYLKIKYTHAKREEFINRASKEKDDRVRKDLISYAESYIDCTVHPLTKSQLFQRCQTEISQLECFAFRLWQSNKKAVDFHEISNYFSSIDANTYALLGLLQKDENEQLSFLNEAFLQYFAARYIASCLSVEFKNKSQNVSNVRFVHYNSIVDLGPYNHNWVNEMPIYDYFTANLDDIAHQTILKYVGCMLKIRTDEESLEFFQSLFSPSSPSALSKN